MMVDRNLMEEYPFDGVFYRYAHDSKAPLEQQGENEVIVLKTRCDIQESSKKDVQGNISASFNVYFPFDKGKGIEIQRGMSFRGSIYGMEVNGTVIGVFPTQLGGCACYISDVDV